MNKVSKLIANDEYWLDKLSPDEYQILRNKGTERAFSGRYNNFKTPGKYLCAACENDLFDSEAKFDSGSGWPSFVEPISEDKISTKSDTSFGMTRVEVMCGKCLSHLGHVFSDGPAPTGLRYCINSISLKHQNKK